MSEYKESTVAGTSYNRAHTIIIRNPKDAAPSGEFHREDVYIFPDREVSIPSSVVPTVYDPGKMIPLRNPETGELLGQDMPMSMLFVLLYSLFFLEATAFDAAAAAAALESPVDEPV